MISFFKSFLLIGVIFGAYTTNDVAGVKVTCNELGLTFTLPAGFTSLDSPQMDALRKRGEKAVNESFNKESLQGWQSVCVNMRDSFKRTVLITAITVKEAVAQSGTVDQFIDKTFKDGDDFMIERFKRRVN